MRPYGQGVGIALCLCAARLVIHGLGVRRALALTWKLADRFARQVRPEGDPLRTARTLAGRIDWVADRIPPPPSCLTRSLVLAGALRRHGLPAELCVGVAGGGEFSAHAWVELNGVALNDTADVAGRYRPIWRIGVLAPAAWPR